MILRELIVKLGLEFDEHGLKRAEEKLGGLKQAALSFATAFAGGMVVREVTEIVNQSTAAAVALSQMATTFGMSAEGLETLQHAAEQSGAGIENLQTGLSRLSAQAFAANSGNVQAAQTFVKLGVSIRDAHGQLKPANQLFGEVADRIKLMKNPTEQVGTAIDLFGRGGAALVPLLKRGSGGIEAYAEDIKHLGAVISEDFIADSKKYRAEQARHALALEGLHRLIAQAILPVFTKFEHYLAEAIGWFNRLLQGTKAIEAAFVVLGAAAIALAVYMALPFLPYIAMALLVIAATVAIILIVDDLWTALTGGQSVIGFLIDKWVKWLDVFTTPATDDNWLMLLLKFFVSGVVDLQGTFVTMVNTVKDAFSGLFGWLGDKLSSAGALLKGLIPDAAWKFLVGDGSSGNAFQGYAQATIPAAASGGTSMNASNSVNVTVNAQGVSDPNAVAVEVGRVVDERLAAHAQDVYSALTPGLAQ